MQPLTGQDLSDDGLRYVRMTAAVAAGRATFNSLRLEKGYRAWGTDLDTGHDPFQSGLGFAVDPAKDGYVGRDAVERLRALDPNGRERLWCLTVDDAATVAASSLVDPEGTAVRG